ncbi:MAG TPA: GAF domain-containing protein [Burkholderiaceae bacterium]|nr:GAF domain-containing protein [Burkholderiaceae bacterium]
MNGAARPPRALPLHALRECFEGAAPAMMGTCSDDGTPNVTYLSQIEYVDPEHVALSFQFFNKTRANVLANPVAQVLVPHPDTAAMYRLDLRYLRTETEGPLFERMKAKLAGIASMSGMAGVFRLRGSDVYRVLALEQVSPGRPVRPAPERCAHHLGALRRAATRLAAATDLHVLLDETLAVLADAFGYEHAMIMLLDRRADRLFTVASRGYPSSGAGSEVPMGAGLVGVAARERTPLRINHLSAEYSYLRAVRESIERAGQLDRLETAIPLPGLRQAHSQLAVPIVAADALLGVLFVESPQDRRFGYDDEDALVALAAQLGATMPLLQARVEPEVELAAGARAADDGPEPGASVDASPPIPLRHYPHDDSVFLGDDYLIKGVAGAVLWLMARDHVERGRTRFTNRELRLDPRLRLPDIGDNLEARLVLLQRRLADRGACIRLERAGRGQLRLEVTRRLELLDVR